MKWSDKKRLSVLLSVAKGSPVSKALMDAGYSRKVFEHKASRILSGKKYLETARTYCETVADQIGREPIAAEAALIENAEKWSVRESSALRKLHETYTEMKPELPTDPTPKKRMRKFDSLMAKHHPSLASRIATSAGPKFLEKVDELIKRGMRIDGEHLGYLGAALLEKDIVNCSADARTRATLARTALEAGGKIGPAAAELHLHQHNHATLPPVVQRMLEEKMLEIAAQQNRPALEAAFTDDVAPPPIDLDPERGTEPTEQTVRELLCRHDAASIETSLAKLREQSRQGAAIALEEAKKRLLVEQESSR